MTQTKRIAVLLIHGLTGMPSEMRPIEKYAASMGLEVATPLLAGHGSTDADLLAATGIQWLESARVALRSLLERNDSVVVCGLSMGGTMAAILAAEEPERVSGVVILSPTLAYDASNMKELPIIRWMRTQFVRDVMHDVCTIFPVVGRTLYWTETPPYGLKDERLQKQITKAVEAARSGENTSYGLFRTYFGSLREMNLLNRDLRKIAHKIFCPVLILHSYEDTLASMSNATNMFALLPAANYRRLAVLTGCDHVLTLDLQRHLVCKIIGEFIAEIGGAGVGVPAEKKKEYAPAIELLAQKGQATAAGDGQPESLSLTLRIDGEKRRTVSVLIANSKNGSESRVFRDDQWQAGADGPTLEDVTERLLGCLSRSIHIPAKSIVVDAK